MNSFYEWFVRYFIKRPLIINLMLFFILLMSALSMIRMQRSALPRVDMYSAKIVTKYPGASPEDVEINVTRKIEDALESVSDIEEYSSMSLENLSVVKLKVRREAEDKDKVIDDIQQELNQISDLPTEVRERPIVDEDKADELPVISIGIATKDKNDNSYIDIAKDLQKELLKLSTVSTIDMLGSDDREIRILLKKDQIMELKVTVDEVIGAIQANTARVSAGTLESFASEKNIVTISVFSRSDDIGDIIVRMNDTNNIIHLKDIASIEPTYRKEYTINRINGLSGNSLIIRKHGNADIVRSVNEIKKALAVFKTQRAMPDSVIITTQDDESIETKQRLDILISNALLGLVLVIVLLSIFFHHRIALWTAVGIPVAVGIAFIFLSLMNITINRVSLLGLIVVLGMLVDDAIIIGESIFSYKLQGYSGVDAAIAGLTAVIGPVIAFVVTTVIAFTPMYVIPGMAMDFAREIPTFVIIMLIASLLEAILILPLHLGHESGKKKNVESDSPLKTLGDGIIKFLTDRYCSLLSWMLKYKWRTFAVINVSFIALITISIVFRFITLDMFPIDQSTKLSFSGETTGNSSLEFTSKAVRDFETILEVMPDTVIQSYQTTIGSTGKDAQVASNLFCVRVTLTPSTGRDMSASEVKDFVLNEIKKRNLSELKNIDYYIDGGGPPAGKPVEIEVVGDETEKRKEIIENVSEDLKGMGLTEIDSNFRPGKNVIKLSPNREMITMGGTSVNNIAMVIRAAFEGTDVSYLDTPNEQIPIHLQYDKNNISGKDPLDGIYTRSVMGVIVPVKNFVHEESSVALQTIYRYNGKRTNRITANLPENMSSEQVYTVLSKKYKDFNKDNPGYRLVIGGEAEENSQTLVKVIIAIGMAIIAVYFVLAIQFNSLIQPVMVISAIPFGLVGIIIAFGVQRLALSLLGLIGVMGYSGVVVNNSLIMVEFINRVRRSEGTSTSQDYISQVVSGASQRLRPILLTTITTVAGLLPTAYGVFGDYDSFVSPMVMTLAWGLIVGTPSVLFVIPLLYSIIDEVKGWMRSVLQFMQGLLPGKWKRAPRNRSTVAAGITIINQSD